MENFLLASKKKLAKGRFKYQFLRVERKKKVGNLVVIAEAYAAAHASAAGMTLEAFLAAPAPDPAADGPVAATQADVDAIQGAAALSLASVAANWKKSCLLGDVEINNCAHYLSDAFIRAGYTELAKGGSPRPPQITAWCDHDGTPDKRARVIRAREIRAWFETNDASPLTSIPVKKGYFAVFQLNESEYWGGHVLLQDSDKHIYFGTEAYWNWPVQRFYQW